MSTFAKSLLKNLLQAMAWLLFVVAGLALWVGGRAINEFTGTERLLAEVEGIGLAAMCGVLGAFAKAAGKDLADAENRSRTSSAAGHRTTAAPPEKY